MGSKGSEIFCHECGKRWTLNEDGRISANSGETEFDSTPDWFEWERSNVIAEVEAGRYSFSDTVDVFSMPRCWRFEKLGKATLSHDPENGYILKGNYNGSEYLIQRTPLQSNSLHVEYDWFRIRRDDCVDISTENDSFYCYFENAENVVTKLAFATEAIYDLNLKKRRSETKENACK